MRPDHQGPRRGRSTHHLHLRVCSSPDDIQTAAAFRNSVFLDRRGFGFSTSDELERRRDEAGFVFLLLDAGSVTATARTLPYPSPLSEVASATGIFGSPRYSARAADSEIGRVAVARSAHLNRYALLLLTLGAAWLLEHTELRHYLAQARPRMVRAYRLLGAQDTGESWVHPERDERLHVIAGSYEACFRHGIGLLGVSAAEARALATRSPGQAAFPPFAAKEHAGAS